jgi:hypothetical protein
VVVFTHRRSQRRKYDNILFLKIYISRCTIFIRPSIDTADRRGRGRATRRGERYAQTVPDTTQLDRQPADAGALSRLPRRTPPAPPRIVGRDRPDRLNGRMPLATRTGDPPFPLPHGARALGTHTAKASKWSNITSAQVSVQRNHRCTALKHQPCAASRRSERRRPYFKRGELSWYDKKCCYPSGFASMRRCSYDGPRYSPAGCPIQRCWLPIAPLTSACE